MNLFCAYVSSVKEMIESINHVMDSLINFLESKADGRIPINLRPLLARAANDIMTAVQ